MFVLYAPIDRSSIGNVHSWTGLSLAALEYYIGLADTIEMGESLAKPSESIEPSSINIKLDDR